MIKRRLLLQKSISLFTGFLLVFQSLTPGFFVSSQILAQEATVTETPTPTPVTTPEPIQTIEPTQTPTAPPTEVISPTPTEEVLPTTPEPTPSVEPSIEVTPVPTLEVTPTIEPTMEAPTSTPSDPPKETSPPANDAEGEILDGVSTESPTPIPTITPVEPETGELQAIILNNLSAPTLNIDGVNPDGSAKLTTDKADYAPTDTAVISGSDFTPGKSYTLIITSSDEPPVHFETTVTADENGRFIYAYQLDGNYRPNYKVEALSLYVGHVITSITFTDSDPNFVCITDTGLVNDNPGQKDLTQMCRDVNSINPLSIDWNWDEISMPGGNTADACSLFDTDNDGFANYSLCVTWDGNQHQISGGTNLYVCDDSRVDRCGGRTPIAINGSTTCSVGMGTDPFVGGSAYPQDTKAICSIDLTDVGGPSRAVLLDVCSYPSDRPNSDPSDCIVIRKDEALLTVIKNVVPDNLTTNWIFTGTGQTNFSETIYNGDGSFLKSLPLGTYSIIETAGNTTNLADYSTVWSCTKNGLSYLSGTSTSATDIVLSKNGNIYDDVVCTFTNTQRQATLTVNKVISPTTDSGRFNLQIDGTIQGTGANVGNGGTTGVITLAPGAHTVSETAVTGTNLSDYTATYDGDCDSSGNVTLATNDAKFCTITNTRNTGTIELKKTWAGTGTQAMLNIGTTINGLDIANTLTGENGGGPLTTGAISVNTGTYYLSETGSLTNYTPLLSCTKNGQLSTLGSDNSISVGKNDVVVCEFINSRNSGHIIVDKVTNPLGDPTTFGFHMDSTDTNTHETFSLADGSPVINYQVSTGVYTISEDALPTGWNFSNVSCTSNQGGEITRDLTNRIATFDLKKDETVTCTFTNIKQGSVSGTKYEDINGNGQQDDGDNGLAGWSIHLYNETGNGLLATTTTSSSGTYEFANITSGNYQVCEINQPSWTNTDPGGGINSPVCKQLTVNYGQNTVIDFGNFKLGLIQGRKYQDSNANGARETSETFLDTWTIRLYRAVDGVWTKIDEKITGHTGTLGQYRFENLDKGRYFVCEVLKDNSWTQTDPFGTEGYANLSGATDEAARCRRVIINTSGERNTGLFFGNIQYGTIYVTKYNDENGDGDRTRVMGGWTITATGQPNQITDENGMVSFTSLVPNSYYIDEDMTGHDGWIQTDITCESQNENPPLTQRDGSNNILNLERIYAQEAPSNLVQLHEGEIVHCYIGNRLIPPEMTISKSNNAVGYKTPGESVLYTITLKVDKNTAHNVFVTDLLPKGFLYRPGSWTASITGGSFDAGHTTISEPTYASPGTWDLGDLTAGSEITLTLIADIVTDKKPGLYKDLATAYGCETEESCAIGSEESVIAKAVAPGYIDKEFHVGTEVTLAKDLVDAKTYNVERKEIGAVLGASTELPSTGANANWIIVAVSFMITGLGAIVISSKMRRYHA